MAAKAIKDKWNEVPEGMKTPLIVSAFFHIALVIVAITGLPYLKNDLDDMESTAIPIEILPIAELTTTNKEPVKAQPAPEPEEKLKPIQKEKPPTPPKVEAVEPPKEITPPKPKTEAKPKPKPVVPPPPTEKLEKPQEKPKPEEKPAEDNSQQFDALLKNLQDSNPAVDETLPESKDAPDPSASPVAPFSEQLTMSEMDALRRQLSNCWSIQAGARYAEELVVEVRLIVSPERRVLSATVVDQWRYGQDSYFRAAADSAIRAVNSPQCEVLQLNPDKYQQWKDLIVEFDPKDML